MSSRLSHPSIIHHTDKKRACVLKPMRLFKYPGVLNEKGSNWRDDILLSALRVNPLHTNINNDIKHHSKTVKQLSLNPDVQIINGASTNTVNTTDIKTGLKELNINSISTQNARNSSKQKSAVPCSIHGNNQNRPKESRRDDFSNSKYFDPVYLKEAAQKMAGYLKTFLNPAESEKENRRPLNCPSSVQGPQNNSESSTRRETSIPVASCKRILPKPPGDVIPLDPQVERLRCLIDCYPSIYVSQSGLINIFLRQGILLEVTVDKAIRLVDQDQEMAAAVSGRSKACCVHHRSVKICQNKSAADIDLGEIWQAKIRTGHIMAGDRRRTVWFDETGNFGTSEYSKYQFVTTSLTDYTVDLLLSSASYGPALVPICKKLVSAAKFECTRIGSVSVQVNDVKVIQKSSGDVIVMAGSKLLKMRPRCQSVEIHTGSTDIAVSPEWGVTCQLRKSLSLTCSSKQLTVSNGSIESRLQRDGQIELRKISNILP